MELFKDTHLVKLELLSNATTIDAALNYIRSRQQEQDDQSSSSQQQQEQSKEDTTTTTGRQTIF